ncbi:MAG: acylphosphatase [Spirochaetaceae bacterium]|nr:acylphosphatase [Spirochaetaceae bacterium]
MEAIEAVISGRVQGVGFRYSAREEARRLGLSGWVRNLDDGTVETRAEGPPEALEAYLAWLHQGPPGAWIESVKAYRSHPTGAFNGFTVEF